MFALLSLLAAASPQTSVAVVPVVAGPPRAETSLSALTEVIAAAATMRPRLRVLTMEEVFAHDTIDALTALRGCGADEACIGGMMSTWPVDLGLLVVINTQVEPPVVLLRLVDVEHRAVIEREGGPLEAGEALAAALRSRAEQLFDRLGHPRQAQLTVLSDPPGAEIEVEGALAIERAPATFWLAPGRHRIHARLEDHRAAEHALELEPGATAQVTIPLAPEPAGPIWPWIAVSAAAVAGVVTAVILLLPDNACVCLGTPAPGCGC